MLLRLIILCVFVGLQCRSATTNIFVSPTGSDSTGNGSEATPYATINKARDILQTVSTNTVRNIFLRGGNYWNVAVKLSRSGDDSGLKIQGYPGETAVLHGGMLITNWSASSNGWYVASLPTFPSLESGVSSLSDWQVRCLLVDGSIAKRSQYPTNGGSLYYTDTSGTTTMHYTGTDLGEWFIPTNSEVQIDYSWDQQTTAATAIDTGTKAVTLNPGASTWQLNYTGIKSYRIYNLAEGMFEPGQFFYDRSNRCVLYWPIGGKNPNTSICVVPTTTTLFFLDGVELSRIWGITLSNLTMKVATVDMIPEGNDGYLWDEPGSMIHGNYLDDLTITDCKIGWTAGNAIGMEYSFNTNTLLRNCEIAYCGGGGAAVRKGQVVITNNFFHDIGYICFQSPAIRANQDAVIVGNSIFNCKLSAYADTYASRVIFSRNYVSNCVQVLRDMGAFYCIYSDTITVSSNLFEQVGLGIQGNGSDARDWFRNTIYFDQETKDSIADHNITLGCKNPFFDHAIDGEGRNSCTNNVFVNFNGEHLRIYSSTDIGSNTGTMLANVILSDTNILVDNPDVWPSWESNVFWSTYSPPLTNNVPVGAIRSDPLFRNVLDTYPLYLNDIDLTFQAGSPAPALGIQPLSIAGIGYNGGLKWRNAGYVTNLNVRNIHVGGSP